MKAEAKSNREKDDDKREVEEMEMRKQMRKKRHQLTHDVNTRRLLQKGDLHWARTTLSIESQPPITCISISLRKVLLKEAVLGVSLASLLHHYTAQVIAENTESVTVRACTV